LYGGGIVATVPVSEFRKHLHSYMKLVQGGEELRLVRHGKVVAVVSPPKDPAQVARERLVELSARAVVGDVESPVDAEWEVDQC
jgi:prevent-host-death family protein